MDEHNKQHKPLRDSLLEKIRSEKVCPHSRLFFQGREFLVWSLWFLSVVVGALAIAVTLFVLVHGQYAFYEATHENFVTFMVETLPYLWIVTFGIMVFTAVYNIRHTKRGYRYPLWVIMASSVVLSFAGGSVLQFFGLGYEIDELFGRHMMFYTSQQKFEEHLWQDPSDGRLIGRQIYSTVAPTSTIIFQDASGCNWTMNISELPPQDVARLASAETVRILGTPTNEDLRLFHVCGVFPWIQERDLTRSELNEQREGFLERAMMHARKMDGRRLEMHGQNFASTTLVETGLCSTLAPMRRLSQPREEFAPR